MPKLTETSLLTVRPNQICQISQKQPNVKIRIYVLNMNMYPYKNKNSLLKRFSNIMYTRTF
jgi:hypothetical protein